MSTNTTTEKEREDQRGKSFESLFPKAEHFELQINSCSLKLLISYLQFNISYIAEESKHRFIFQAEASNILELQRLKHEDLLCFLSVNWIIASLCARGKLRNGHSEHTWLNLLVLFTHRNRSIIFLWGFSITASRSFMKWSQNIIYRIHVESRVQFLSAVIFRQQTLVKVWKRFFFLVR